VRVTAPTIMSLAVLILTCAGCDESLKDVAGPTPNLTPTFTSIQRDVFNASDSRGRPACISCHNAAGARFTGNLSLVEGASYQALVGVASTGKAGAIRVVPGEPDASYLLNKVLGTDIVGDRMPRLGPYLSDGQIRIIRRWIELGAKND
jgi:Planctomycete cytochrome C